MKVLLIAVPLIIIAITLVVMVAKGDGDPLLADCKKRAEAEYGAGSTSNWVNNLLYEGAMDTCDKQAENRKLSPEERAYKACVTGAIINGRSASQAAIDCKS